MNNLKNGCELFVLDIIYGWTLFNYVHDFSWIHISNDIYDKLDDSESDNAKIRSTITRGIKEYIFQDCERENPDILYWVCNWIIFSAFYYFLQYNHQKTKDGLVVDGMFNSDCCLFDKLFLLCSHT